MARRKYIIVRQGTLEVPILFSELQSHAEVAQAFNPFETVSAGFWGTNTDDQFVCYGDSFSLKLASRPVEDSRILNQLFNGY